MVDPLDGTREFVKRNGEFTVNIALVVDHEPVLGIVAAPAQRNSILGSRGHRRLPPGCAGRRRARSACPPPASPLRVVGSRSHMSPETAAYLAGFPPHEMTGVGSSLKFCLLAEGNAELYPRFGPTSEWDTAAGQALLEAAGGQVTRMDGHRLRYNCRESVLNGDFVAFSHPSVLTQSQTRSRRRRSLERGARSRRNTRQACPAGSQNCKVASSSVGMSNTTSSPSMVSRATPAAAISAAGT